MRGWEREADRLTETARDRDRGETDRHRLRQRDIDSVSNLVFYAQSITAVISETVTDRQTEWIQ